MKTLQIEDKLEVKASSKRQGGDLFIVDNSDAEWKVNNYLREWTDIAHSFDIATGYFEIGALLALEGQWQKLDRLRILMGDEVTKRTKKALLAGIQSAITQTLDASIEREKETNDFLHGVPAIVEALSRKQIECRVLCQRKVSCQDLHHTSEAEDCRFKRAGRFQQLHFSGPNAKCRDEYPSRTATSGSTSARVVRTPLGTSRRHHA